MKIEILAFGIIKDIVGCPSLQLEIEGEIISVKQLRNELEERYPQFKSLSSYMIALNNSYARDEEKINSTDEIALIPPVSGG